MHYVGLVILFSLALVGCGDDTLPTPCGGPASTAQSIGGVMASTGTGGTFDDNGPSGGTDENVGGRDMATGGTLP